MSGSRIMWSEVSGLFHGSFPWKAHHERRFGSFHMLIACLLEFLSYQAQARLGQPLHKSQLSCFCVSCGRVQEGWMACQWLQSCIVKLIVVCTSSLGLTLCASRMFGWLLTRREWFAMAASLVTCTCDLCRLLSSLSSIARAWARQTNIPGILCVPCCCTSQFIIIRTCLKQSTYPSNANG